MSYDWIISLAAVLVSMLTIVISYLSNRETLKHASLNNLSEHKMNFNESVWKDIIDLSDKLLLLTNRDHFERLANIVIAAKTQSEGKERILNTINEECAKVRSVCFNLTFRIKTLDPTNTALIERIDRYSTDVVDTFKGLQQYYLDEGHDPEKYSKILTNADLLSTKETAFRDYMLEYVAKLQKKLFENATMTRTDEKQ